MSEEVKQKKRQGKQKSTESDLNTDMTTKPKRKRTSESSESPARPQKTPKLAAASTELKDKSARKGKTKAESKKCLEVSVEQEAIRLTPGTDYRRHNRRLTDFVFFDGNGVPQSVDALEVVDIFISALILPLEETSDKDMKGVRCNRFGRIESWSMSGYEEGTPVIWISTADADYECIKPANSYKKLYSLLYGKACACIEVYQKLSKSCRGDSNLSLDKLLGSVVRAISGRKDFPRHVSVRDFVVSHGEFIYKQLIGLDKTSNKDDPKFRELPILAALMDASKKISSSASMNLKIENGDNAEQSFTETYTEEESEDLKLSRLLQEKENWQSKRQKRKQHTSSSSKNYYIKINEDEIENDYPFPAYYKNSVEETDGFVIFGSDANNPVELPQKMLHNWTLYNSDFRLITLELLPMKPCSDIDVTIFGSGIVTVDDGIGFNNDEVSAEATSSSLQGHKVDGIPVYLSAIREWKIDVGPSMVVVSVRTDMAWYRLGRPSNQYAPWFAPVLRATKLSVSIIKLLEEQSRVSRLSFSDVLKRVSQFNVDHPAYIASNTAAVENFIVVRGQIIRHIFAEYPDNGIKRCAFVAGIHVRMEQRRHSRWSSKKNISLKKQGNSNPQAAMKPAVSKRKVMPATTTRLINRIWGEFYSNYTQEVVNAVKEDDEEPDEESGEGEGERELTDEQPPKCFSSSTLRKPCCSSEEIKWEGEAVGRTCSGEAVYKLAMLHEYVISCGDYVLVKTNESEEHSPIYLIEYMYQKDTRKLAHGRLMVKGLQTVIGNTGNERELFLTNDCLEFDLSDIIQKVGVEIQLRSWGHQYRKSNAVKDSLDRAKAEERKRQGLPMEYFCKTLYCPDKGGFFCLQTETMGLGSGVCPSCKIGKAQTEEAFKINASMNGFTLQGTEYFINDFAYLAPHQFGSDNKKKETFKSGRNVGLKPYVICQLLEIEGIREPKLADFEFMKVKVRRFFRPDDVSAEKSYRSDIHEVYYSNDLVTVPLLSIKGKCEVRRKRDFPLTEFTAQHIFFCDLFYDHISQGLHQLPADITLSPSKEREVNDTTMRKNKGKCKEGEVVSDEVDDRSSTHRLATLDIFAGCGGLSEGFQKSGVSLTKWAIEFEEAAGEAFSLNHPEAAVVLSNCNVILRAIMGECGDAEDCIATPEAEKLAGELDHEEKSKLPRPGEVDFINGGPPCQGFSGMNRFNQSTWSKVQCEMILSFLSFADYFRPKFFLLENVRNFVSYNKGQTFRLTLASLLEMGYQVRFGILEAGAYGVSQSRKRAFIWAASPEEILPDWPEPMHVFAGPELKINMTRNTQYAAVRSTSSGAPFRAITVRDTIGDLPPVKNGASATKMEYQDEPVSWYQKKIRGETPVLTDHISKEMNELNLIRCQRIPKQPGADWRNLPDEKVRLSSGQIVDLIPRCLPNTADRHNQWKGLFGRLDWEGNFPTSVTDPQPMGKVGMCFHPEQDRILTVRECARSQGFPDSYMFSGNIHQKHRQIGNAVPPPLAFALGRKLKEAVERKRRS